MCFRTLLILTAVATMTGCGDGLTIRVTESELQSTVDGYFPMDCSEYSEREAPVKVFLTDAIVILAPGSDRFALKISVEVSGDATKDEGPLPGPPLLPRPGARELEAASSAGTVTASGKLEYRSDEGAFFVLEPRIDEVNFARKPPPELEKAIRRVAAQALKKYLGSHAVYTLSDEDSKSKAAKWLLKSVTIQDGEMLVVFGP